MTRIRIGITGAGFGVRAHLPALLAHPRFEVVALASPHSAQRVAADRGIPHAFTSCAQMVSGCDLDAVTVASPPFDHETSVLAALAAHKHVLCEKPFALDLASAQTMLEAARAAGTACGVSHEFRFIPQAQALRELVVNGHLDPLRDLEVTLLQSMLRSDAQRERGWWFQRECGGGVAGSALSHLVDGANWLVGQPLQRSTGYLRTAVPLRRDAEGEFTSTVADGAFALIEYAGGCVARVSVDATVAVESYTCAVHGQDRTAVSSGERMTDVRLFSIDDDETNELECKPAPYARFASIDRLVPPLMELYDQFAHRIDAESNSLPTFEEAFATQTVLESIGYTRNG